MMKALLVLTLELPDPEAIVATLEAVNPPSVPHFAGDVRIVVEPHASTVTTWLDAP